MRIVFVALFGLSASSALGTETSVPFINADVVHAQGITGRGVTVAVIDTGIFYYQHGLLGSISPDGMSFTYGTQTSDGGQDISPALSGGHGTYMSLIITDATGVAPSATILPIRILDVYQTPNGPVYSYLTIDYVHAVQYVIACQALDSGIRVINHSAGGGLYSCPCDYVDIAVVSPRWGS